MTAHCPAAADRSTSTTRARRPARPCSSRTASSRATCRTSMNARLMGVASTGNGRRESYAHLPMPRMTNTYMLRRRTASRGDHRLASTKGLYAVNFGGGQVDITSGKFVFSASEAYLIEDGKITAAGERRHPDRQRPRRPHPRQHGGQRPGTGYRRRRLRQGGPECAGGRRPANLENRRTHRRRNHCRLIRRGRTDPGLWLSSGDIEQPLHPPDGEDRQLSTPNRNR